jgi:hypothetical protein
MKAFGIAILFGASLFGPSVVMAQSADGCDVGEPKTMGDLQVTLSRRAVEIINRAAAAGFATDARLQQLVVPSVTFGLGAGDVGLPLGTGLGGARKFARYMNADSFRFLGSDYIPMIVSEPCGIQKVDVEFVNTRGGHVYPVSFTFKAGRLVDAAGWTRSFESGPVEPVRG